MDTEYTNDNLGLLKANTTGKLYPAGVFFMQLKMGAWTQGYVEGAGLVSLFTEYPAQKALYAQYREVISAPMRVGTDMLLCSLKVLCKNIAWDLSSVAVAMFRVKPLNGVQKEIAVKISESEALPFSNLFKKYQPKDEHPVIEMDDKTVSYNGSPHTVSISPVLPLQYICLETKQTLTEPPVDAGEYLAYPIGKNDIGAKLTIKKAPQEIKFEDIASKTYGDADFNLTAYSNSGLDVYFETPDTDIITIDGNNVKILKAGQATINANQQGGRNYLPAKTVSSLFEIEKSGQQISFNKIKNKYIKDQAFELAAISSSGLPIEFETQDTDLIGIDGTTVTIKNTGKVTVIAKQNGNNNYKAAEPVVNVFVIEKGFWAWVKKIFRKTIISF